MILDIVSSIAFYESCLQTPYNCCDQRCSEQNFDTVCATVLNDLFRSTLPFNLFNEICDNGKNRFLKISKPSIFRNSFLTLWVEN